MKILFLTSRLPYPPHQGDKLRSWHFLQYLTQQNDIHLISIFNRESEKQYLPKLEKICASVTLVKLPFSKSLMNCMKAIGSQTPFQVAFYESKCMHDHVELAVERIKPHIIHAHMMRMAPYALKFKNYAKVLDLTDAVSLYLSRFKQYCNNPVIRLFIAKELKRVLEYEKVVTEFQSTLICSTRDRGVLQDRYPGARIDLINNSVEMDESLFGGTVKRDPHRILFTGNMSYPPNSDAVRYFVHNIFPSVVEKIPEAKFYIVGKNPNRSIRALRSNNIIITGFVKSIEKEYLASSVIVSPVRFGAGALNKVLEPLMLGIPVVSTSIGVEGLQLQNENELFITDDPIQFATYVINLMLNPILWQRIVDSAKRVSLKRFKMDVSGRALMTVYNELVQNYVGRLKN